jgi:hypothetical protein
MKGGDAYYYLNRKTDIWGILSSIKEAMYPELYGSRREYLPLGLTMSLPGPVQKGRIIPWEVSQNR